MIYCRQAEAVRLKVRAAGLEPQISHMYDKALLQFEMQKGFFIISGLYYAAIFFMDISETGI